MLQNHYVAQHVARTKAAPLGSRQRKILAYLRHCETMRQPVPTPQQIADYIKYRSRPTDIEWSLLGLAARGLIEPTTRRQTQRGTMPSGWRVTDEGWRT